MFLAGADENHRSLLQWEELAWVTNNMRLKQNRRGKTEGEVISLTLDYM